MRKGFDGLAALVQEKLRHDPFGGQIFVFRGRRGRADQGAVVAQPGAMPVCLAAGAGSLRLAVGGRWAGASAEAQLGMLLEGIDWRMLVRTWRQTATGQARPVDSSGEPEMP